VQQNKTKKKHFCDGYILVFSHCVQNWWYLIRLRGRYWEVSRNILQQIDWHHCWRTAMGNTFWGPLGYWSTQVHPYLPWCQVS